MLLLVSAWFVDLFIMTVRVVLYCRRRLLRGAATGDGAAGAGGGEKQKFALPLWAFPLMWLVVFVVLVSVSSVEGTKDPVTRRVEVGEMSRVVFHLRQRETEREREQ